MHRPHPRRGGRSARPALASIALVLAALLTAVAAAQAVGARPVGSPGLDPAGLIAFVDPDGAVGLLDPRTGAVRRSDGGGLERAQFPAWSSDGNRVAVIVADLAGGRVDHIDAATGGAPVTIYRVAGQAPIYLAWAPGDRTLAVLATAPGGTLALDLVDVEAALAAPRSGAAPPPDPAGAVRREAVRPFARGAPFYWTWSRTGRSLLVHQNVMGSAALAGISPIDAFDVRSPLPDPGAFQSPALSSSERYLAYATLDAAGRREVVALPNPARPDPSLRPTSLPHQGMAAFAWRPGSEQLAVQRATVPSPHAFGPVDLLDAESGRVTRLSEDTVVASWWSPDGRWLATLSAIGGGGDRTVIGAGSWNRPGGSTEGLQTAAARTETVQGRGRTLMSLKVIDPDTLETRVLAAFAPSPLFTLQYLPFFDQYARSHRLWSPRSDALVLPALDDDGVPTLVVFGIDGATTPLVPGDLPAWNVR